MKTASAMRNVPTTAIVTPISKSIVPVLGS
jgi:hypothetical protein